VAVADGNGGSVCEAVAEAKGAKRDAVGVAVAETERDAVSVTTRDKAAEGLRLVVAVTVPIPLCVAVALGEEELVAVAVELRVADVDGECEGAGEGVLQVPKYHALHVKAGMGPVAVPSEHVAGTAHHPQPPAMQAEQKG
jgi:hypothetical protein